jgi:hypothetical protein
LNLLRAFYISCSFNPHRADNEEHKLQNPFLLSFLRSVNFS